MNIGKSLRNVGSKATDTAMSKASRVAMGKSGASNMMSVPSMQKPLRRQIHRGSAAGLQNQKVVHLNMNGTGYLNPANQTARYTKRSVNIPRTSFGGASFAPRNRTFDTRTLGSSCGTVKLLRERI